MKKQVVALCLGVLTLGSRNFCQDAGNTQHQQEVANWLKKQVLLSDNTLKISPHELQVLLNLFYFSYARSAITMKAQQDSLHALETTWQTWQNIMQTRRNPSKDLPHPIDEPTYAHDTQLLFNLQTEHRQIGATYARILEMIFDEHYLTNDPLVAGIQEIRDDARKAVVSALTNVREYVNSLLHINTRTIDNGTHELQETAAQYTDIMTRSFNIAEYIWSMIPQLAMNSFVKADRLSITISQEWWKALYQMLTISNAMWTPLETARGQLYLEYYKQLHAIATSTGMNKDTYLVIFDERGIIDTVARVNMLPHPSALSIQ